MSEPYLGEIKIFPWNWAPKGWQLCDGTVLQVQGNQALYSLLGNRFGGTGPNTFAVPDLRGRVPLHYWQAMGQLGGLETVTLTVNNLPAHTHQMMGASNAATLNGPSNANLFGAAAQYNAVTTNTPLSSQTCSSYGGGQAHANVQPSIVANYCISLTGYYPPRP